ncbi:MAG TPA: alpha/beta fold hydrolase [Candidatus Saccharimonadales bacterium]
MEQFDASNEWGTKKQISVLKNPISEFNARGGMDLVAYLALEEQLVAQQADFGKEKWDKIKANLPSFQFIEDPLSNQKLRTQRFNWPPDGEDITGEVVTVFNLPFSVPIDLKHLMYQHHLLAEALETPLLIIENPGYGESDQLTRNQKKSLKNSGDYGPIAESMLGIIAVLGVKKINCMGYSMGSDVAAAIASHASEKDIEVVSLFIMESARGEKQNPLKLLGNFASDKDNLNFTWQHPIDPVMREVTKPEGESPKGLKKLNVNMPKGLLTYGRSLYKGGLQNDLQNAFNTQPNMKLTLGSADSSKISTTTANRKLYRLLKSEYRERSIRRIIIPGESHAYGDSGKRYANLGRLVLH